MKEAGVVIDHQGAPLFWHFPPSRTTAGLPDSHVLWDILWTARESIAGFAHSHPGTGLPRPSQEDLTTFAAIEAALGRRIEWWIVSYDRVASLTWVGPGRHDYTACPVPHEPAWTSVLRLASWQGEERDGLRDVRGTSQHHVEWAER